MELSTNREIKSQQTKEKILNAAIELMNTHGVSYLTVKNICKTAGISNGTFFHYFDSKESLVAYYMHSCYDEYTLNNELKLDQNDFINAIIELHLHNIRYTKEIGLDFVKNYYNINNFRLRNRNNMDGEKYSKLIINMLENAKSIGYISSDEDIQEIGANICMIAKGVIFEWGLCGDSFDIEFYISKMLRIYLNTIVTSDYIDKYKKL